MKKRLLTGILLIVWGLASLIGLAGCSEANVQQNSEAHLEASSEASSQSEEAVLQENEEYYSTEEVALYLHLYGHLPDNYITKKEAMEAGWVSSEGNLWEVTDHKCIGGDRFGNYDEKLPVQDGRKYYECDVEYAGGYRGASRIICSNDGLIYYTGDHYETFTLLYGEEDGCAE